jgi:phosphinothricin acetyltransferase
MIIRPAVASDADELVPILNALISTTAIEWTETPHTTEGIEQWLLDHDTVLVGEEHGQIVAVAAYGWFRDSVKWPGYRFTVENTIHVRVDRWGAGLGRTLMGALIEKARECGMHTMVAAVDGANEGSIRFHEGLGFVEVARMPEVGAKFGKWQELVLLQLRLDSRNTPDDV